MGNKAVISLTTGLDDPEKVTVAFFDGRRGGRAGTADHDLLR
jgi:hypothetical protein